MAVTENASRMFSQLVRAKLEGVTLISDTDLFELCKNTLLVMPPNPDYFWVATSAPVRSFVGGKLAWKDPETAIHFADIGAKSAGPAFVKRLMLHKVNCLVDVKEYEKATELLDSIKEADLPNDLKNMRFKAAAKLKRNLKFDAK